MKKQTFVDAVALRASDSLEKMVPKYMVRAVLNAVE